MTDFILDISFDARDAALEERVQSLLFLSASTGSSSVEVNGTTTISAYFASPEDRDAAARELHDVELHATERARVDWLDLYQQSLEPIAIGKRFIVAPDASLITSDDRFFIVVPQEQAFGTGSHETTSLCIEILETLGVAGKRGLDVGAGSGILAIAMHRLGAAKIIAFDNDPDAYGALRDNRIRNAVPPAAMPLFIGGIEALRGGKFDVITMNIVPEIILPLLSRIASHMASEAQLLLSGILAVRRGDVVETAAEQHALRLVEERQKGEWWAGVFQH